MSTNTVGVLNELHLRGQAVLYDSYEIHRMCTIHLPKLQHRLLQLQLRQKHIVRAHLCDLVLHQSDQLITQRDGKLLVFCIVLVNVRPVTQISNCSTLYVCCNTYIWLPLLLLARCGVEVAKK